MGTGPFVVGKAELDHDRASIGLAEVLAAGAVRHAEHPSVRMDWVVEAEVGALVLHLRLWPSHQVELVAQVLVEVQQLGLKYPIVVLVVHQHLLPDTLEDGRLAA